MELISGNSKFEGYKINIQKPITFLYTSNKQVEFEIKNTTVEKGRQILKKGTIETEKKSV